LLAFRTEKELLQARYLLGDLSEQEKVAIEESYFADDNSFQELEIIEGELVDAYVREELAQGERQQFEKLLHSSARLSGRVEFARILANRVRATTAAPITDTGAQVERSVKAEQKQTWWHKIFVAPQPGRTLAFAGTAVIGLLAVALLFTWLQLRQTSRALELERAARQQQQESLNAQSSEQASRINQLAAELERERNLRVEDQKLIESLRNDSGKETTSPSSVFASIFLTPGLTRDGSGTGRTVTLRPGQSGVRLLLSIPGGSYKSYRAALKNQDGVEILHTEGLRSRRTPSGNQIAFQFSAAAISTGDYVASVSGQTSSGWESITDYAFRLVQAR
jgi:type II secretory pathway pseudopilin PulG